MTNSFNLSHRARRALDWIENKDYDQDQLRNIFNNVLNDAHITEEEREVLVGALEVKLRTTAPRIAKSLFGPKDAEARDMLREIYKVICSDFDLSNNRVGMGVKTGGDMIAGRAYIDIYFSYKNDDHWHTAFTFKQLSPSSVPSLIVKLYQRGESNTVGREYDQFPIAAQNVAEEKFRTHLKRILLN